MVDYPRARRDGLIVKDFDGEAIVYDERSLVAHSLSEAAVRVWGACTGSLSLEDIANEAGVTPEVAAAAVVELDDCELLLAPAGGETGGWLGAMSRRGLLVRGAAALSVPLVMSVAVPSAFAAASSVLQTLTVTGFAYSTLSYSVSPAGSTGTVGHVSSLWVSDNGTVTEGGNPGNALQFTDNVQTLQLTNQLPTSSVTYSVTINGGSPQTGTLTPGEASPNIAYTSGQSISVTASFT